MQLYFFYKPSIYKDTISNLLMFSFADGDVGIPFPNKEKITIIVDNKVTVIAPLAYSSLDQAFACIEYFLNGTSGVNNAD